MVRTRATLQATSVHLDRGNVFMTVTPSQAVAVAELIQLGSTDQVRWVDDIVHQLFHAGRTGQRVATAPGVSRAAFLRGAWFDAAGGEVDASLRPVVDTADVLPADEDADPPIAYAVHGPAAVAVAKAVVEATAAQPTVEHERNRAVLARAAELTHQAVTAAATRAARAAEHARGAKAVAAAVAARSLAEIAADAAVAVQLEADASASVVARAAKKAAAETASAVSPGDEAEAALTASRLAATVTAAAVMKAEETCRAAAMVASAVATAAGEAATVAAEAAFALEREVANAAAAVEAVAAATARRAAGELETVAADLALDAVPERSRGSAPTSPASRPTVVALDAHRTVETLVPAS